MVELQMTETNRPVPFRGTSVHLLTNPAAGEHGERAFAAVRDAAIEFGFTVSVLRPGAPDEVSPMIATERDAVERLVIVGGDGLVHHALPAVVTHGIEIGIVPAGSGNDIVRGTAYDVLRPRESASNGARGQGQRPQATVRWGIRMPQMMLGQRKAAQYLRDALVGPSRAFDVLRTNDGRYIASSLTTGFSAEVNAQANERTRIRGRARYVLSAAKLLPSLAATAVTVEIDETTVAVDSCLVAVANTAFFGGGMAIAPQADARDGLIDVVVVDAVSPSTLARVLPFVFGGHHLSHDAVSVYRGKQVQLKTAGAMHADGEALGLDAIGIDIAPRAVRIAGPVSP